MFEILSFWNLFFSLSTSVTFLHAYFWLIVYVSPRYENCLMHMRVSMIVTPWPLAPIWSLAPCDVYRTNAINITLFCKFCLCVVALFSKWSWNFQICAGRYISYYTQFKSKRPVTKYNNKSIPEGYV